MACYHPLKAFPVGLTSNGKPNYKVCSYEVDHVEILGSGQVVCCSYPYKPMFRGSLSKKVVTDFVEIPCGKCIGCRIEYSRQWANRLMLELQSHDSAYFVTLTYNEEHVPTSSYEGDFGDCYPSLTLCKGEVQLFMKRLRKMFPNDHIRYYLAGEYGSNTMRPHYHAIIFGLHLPPDDLIPYSKSVHGFTYSRSLSLEKCWSDVKERGEYDSPCICGKKYTYIPKGFVCVADVTWETCAYVARYVTKKLTGQESSFYSLFGIEPPFSLMSRKPGIGREYYDSHPDMFDHDYIHISSPDGGKKFRPPKYYQKLYEIEEPELSQKLKETRKKMAIAQKELKLSRTDLSYLELLAVEEKNFTSKIKTLERSKV